MSDLTEHHLGQPWEWAHARIVSHLVNELEHDEVTAKRIATDNLNDLLASHRSALAGETEQETMEKAVDYLVADMGDDPSLATSTVYQLAPILRASLLLQLQDKNERIKALEERGHCPDCTRSHL